MKSSRPVFHWTPQTPQHYSVPSGIPLAMQQRRMSSFFAQEENSIKAFRSSVTRDRHAMSRGGHGLTTPLRTIGIVRVANHSNLSTTFTNFSKSMQGRYDEGRAVLRRQETRRTECVRLLVSCKGCIR